MRTESSGSTKEIATITAKGRGFPRVSLEDGKERSAAGASVGGGNARVMDSADFDSDGIADLVVADSSGSIRLYRGNVESIYPSYDRKSGEEAEVGAFREGFRMANAPVSPDYLAAGDFTADGHQDVVVAAKNDSKLYLFTGNGRGGFSEGRVAGLQGQLTSLTAGEIGRADGQTDLAVGINGEGGPAVVVYENPEGAFSRHPEQIKLGHTATEIVLGSFDGDSFGDIAVASGNDLSVIHGRGQVGSWEFVEGIELRRPDAIVETRSMPFEIAAMEAGRFTERRGDSLAVLTSSGLIVTVDSPARKDAPAWRQQDLRSAPRSAPVKDQNAAFARHAEFNEQLPATAAAVSSETEPAIDRDALRRGDVNATGTASRERAKANFLRAISPAAVAPLREWSVATLTQDPVLARSAVSQSMTKLVRVRVSDAGRDELAIIDSSSNQTHLWVRENLNRTRDPRATQLVSLDITSAPVAIHPMRLNADAMSDLVVLREGSSEPSVVMTSPAATFVVNTYTDDYDAVCDSECTLREAIGAANQSPGVDTISFNVDGGGSTVLDRYSEITRIRFPVTIDGRTQPGFSGTPLIEVRGESSDMADNGLAINSANVVVRGMAFGSFMSLVDEEDGSETGGAGITIFNFIGETHVTNCIIEGNYLGVSSGGTIDYGNEQAGLFIFDSDSHTIGGTTALARNVISGNGNGEVANGNRQAEGIKVIDGRTNTITGNYIGLNATGTAAIPNTTGILLSGSENNIGGDAAGAANVISGNRHSTPHVTFPADPTGCIGYGLFEASGINLDTGEWITNANNYKANRIGTNAAGTAAIGNCRTGLFVSPRNTPFVGSIAASGRNTVSGNQAGGLFCSTQPATFIAIGRPQGEESREVKLGDDPPPPNPGPVGYCRVLGNNVGTDVTGANPIPNTFEKNYIPGGVFFGINFISALAVYNTETFSSIGDRGGTSDSGCTGFCNLVSGNGSTGGMFPTINGIARRGLGSVGIWKNYVGTNQTGTAGLGTKGPGVSAAHETYIGGTITVSGVTSSLGNLISGNSEIGLSAGVVEGSEFKPVIVQGNLVGTDRTGTYAIPNQIGMEFFGELTALFLGGSNPLHRNIVSGNQLWGVRLNTGATAPIINNSIGVNAGGAPLGNGSDGLLLTGTYDYVGDSGAGNIIAHNGRNGILIVRSTSTATMPAGNRIRFNSIHSNGTLGIDLNGRIGTSNPDGVTANDCLDGDSGPNGLQNYPFLAEPVANGDGTFTIEGALKSDDSTTYTIDMYASSAADPTKYGEGETYIGSQTVTTDDLGLTTFFFTTPAGYPASTKFTATATDPDGNTSEFSCYAGGCQAERPAPEGVGSCNVPIVVNVTTDQPDNSNNGICDVSAAPGLQCSLRGAIMEANRIAGHDNIDFAIPGPGPHVITPATPFESISERVSINGVSQNPSSGPPPVEINGINTPENSSGFLIQTGGAGSKIWGFAIHSFTLGIVAIGGDNDLWDNYIGLNGGGNAGGTQARNRYGIVTDTGDGNRILRNVVSNTGQGITFQSGSHNNAITDTHIGTTPFAAEGTIPNEIGVSIFTAGNTIEGSVISGNSAAGVEISSTGANNTVKESKIGTNFLGTQPMPNTIGIQITGSTNHVLNNIVSGNTSAGVSLFAAAATNEIKGNKIGTLASGMQAMPNGEGVRLKDSAHHNTIEQNVISGNTNYGVHLADDTVFNTVKQNLVGLGGDGGATVGNSWGFFIQDGSANNTILDNVISGNSVMGISIIETSHGNTITSNEIGTNQAGTSARPNGVGISISGESFSNRIRENTISGNTGAGVVLDGTTSDNILEDNKIGTNKNGDGAVANQIGIHHKGESIESGGVRNLISGNTEQGILFSGSTNGNGYEQCKIGSNAAGDAALGNRIGVEIKEEANSNNFLNNLVSGNSDIGFLITGTASYNSVAATKIGTNEAGTAALIAGQTGVGVHVGGAAHHNDVSGNLISGLAIGVLVGVTSGLDIEPSEVRARAAEASTSGGSDYIESNTVSANFIGLNGSRSGGIPNSVGIAVSKNARNNSIGAPEFANLNYVVRSTLYGIMVGTFGGSTDEDEWPQANRFRGNVLGITPDGERTSIPNVVGFKIIRARDNLFGGPYTPASQMMFSNIIYSSIQMQANFDDFSHNNVMLRNFFGVLPPTVPFFGKPASAVTSPEGTNAAGIVVEGNAANNTLGGSAVEDGLIITGSGTSGILIKSTAGNGNRAGANSSYGNDGLGIDIGGDGFTWNDPGDADTGPNKLQNYPEIISKQIVGGDLVIVFKVDSAPGNSNYGTDGIDVDFFEAENSGEGERFLGSTFFTVADYTSGTKTLNLGNAAALGIDATDLITATATDADGNTSEYFPALAPTAAGVSVAGTVSDGTRGIGRATVTLQGPDGFRKTATTNPFGHFQFDDVPAGSTYWIDVKTRRYRFDTRVIQVHDYIYDLVLLPAGML